MTLNLHSPSHTHYRRSARLGAAAALTAILVCTNPGFAQAHVQVHPESTTSGSFSALTFRVPNESDAAGTVKVSVQLPQEQPFLYTSTKPVPGWRVTMTEADLPKPVQLEGASITKAVRSVTWSAEQGTQILPGQYQEFALSVGPLPAPGRVLLPATQTYSDGTVVNWDQPTPASGAEPEHPAPELDVTAAETATATPPASLVNGSATAAAGASDTTARRLGGGALALAIVAVGLALAGWRRRSSSTAPSGSA